MDDIHNDFKLLLFSQGIIYSNEILQRKKNLTNNKAKKNDVKLLQLKVTAGVCPELRRWAPAHPGFWRPGFLSSKCL